MYSDICNIKQHGIGRAWRNHFCRDGITFSWRNHRFNGDGPRIITPQMQTEVELCNMDEYDQNEQSWTLNLSLHAFRQSTVTESLNNRKSIGLILDLTQVTFVVSAMATSSTTVQAKDGSNVHWVTLVPWNMRHVWQSHVRFHLCDECAN